MLQRAARPLASRRGTRGGGRLETNPYSPPAAPVVAAPLLDATPALWNPNAAANWSLLFTPIFGALVQMKNWQALGEPERAASSRNWAVIGFVFMLLVVLATVFLAESRSADALIRAFALAFLLSWYFSAAKHQVRFVENRFGKTYPRRPWKIPLLLGLAGTLGIYVLAFVAVMLADLAGLISLQ